MKPMKCKDCYRLVDGVCMLKRLPLPEKKKACKEYKRKDELVGDYTARTLPPRWGNRP